MTTAGGHANLVSTGGTLPASCTPGAQVINNVPLSCPGISTSLAASASGTFLVNYTMPQGGSFTNCVSITAAPKSAVRPPIMTRRLSSGASSTFVPG